MTAPVDIRAAGVADAELVHSFARLLAEQSDDLAKFHATADDIRDALAGDSPAIESLIAFQGTDAVGCAIFFRKFSTYTGKPDYYLEDLIVRPELQGRGIGQQLLERVAVVARERGASRLEWFVDRKNERGIRFYARLAAETAEHIVVMRLGLNR